MIKKREKILERRDKRYTFRKKIEKIKSEEKEKREGKKETKRELLDL
jgi:hypothetical protein